MNFKKTQLETKSISINPNYFTLILILTFIILISLTIRFPWIYSYHERGADSFFYHRMTNVLITFHEWTWLLHPLSIWGLYPYSDSPASPFIVAEVSLTSGFDIEKSIIIYDFTYMILGVLSAFLLGLKIKKNLLFASVLSITISLAPKAVFPDIFSLDERVALVLFLPYVFLLSHYLISGVSEKSIRYKILVIYVPSLIVLSTTHLMSLFYIPFMMAYPIYRITRSIKHPIKNEIGRYYPWVIMILFTLLFYSLFILSNIFNIPGFNIDTYNKTALFSGTDPITIALNIAVSITGGSGILFVIFGLLGGTYLIFKKTRTPFEKYFIISILLITPFIINRLYIRPFLILIVGILSAYGALFILRHHKNKDRNIKKTMISIIIASIIVSLAFTGFMIYRWNTTVTYSSKIPPNMSEQSYMVAVWMNKKTKIYDIFISNNQVVSGRVEAYANRIMIPGRYSTDLDNLAFYKLYKNKSELGIKFNNWFNYKNIYSNREKWIGFATDYVKVMTSTKTTATNTLEKYDISYFLYFSKKGPKFNGYYDHGLYTSSFCEDMPTKDYTVYKNEWYQYIYITY